jgi:ParB family chromosome partitioning protein
MCQHLLFILAETAVRSSSIPLGNLFVSEFNARKNLQAGQEDSGISELAASIRQKGLLSPLIVRPGLDGRHEVLIGQRRLLACQQMGLDPVPCLIRDDLDDADAIALSLIENVHRADMHPLDKARALNTMYERYGSYEQVAKETAWSTSTVRKYVHLLSLPAELQHKIGTDEGPAKVSALAKLAIHFSGDEALEVYEKICGFRQSIQEAIIKRSEGDISRIDELVAEAHEGAFNVRRCGGAYGCEIVKDILDGKVTQADFEDLVKEAARVVGSDLSAPKLRDAARAFWKTLGSA